MESERFFPELGFYGLPGHALDPRALVAEVWTAERLGLGSVWLSERFNTKNVEVLSGVAAALTSRMGIASGLMANMPLRNPLVTAGYASTMAKLTGDRFALGVGRGVGGIADASGTARLDFALMEDYITVLRRLWRGETVTHDGPAGRFRNLTLGTQLDPIPPVIVAAMGDRTAYWAGRHCDGVLFNSLWSSSAVARSTEIVRKGAVDAGRDPADVTIWTVLVTACEVDEETFLSTIVRRMNSYLYVPGMFESLCEVNGWDASLLAGIRARVAEADAGLAKGPVGDEGTTRSHDQLRKLVDLYPESWITEGNAVGTRADCARAARDRLDAGADGVLFHGTDPADLEPLLAAWESHRPERVRSAANPGR